jgi:hypothetical protein
MRCPSRRVVGTPLSIGHPRVLPAGGSDEDARRMRGSDEDARRAGGSDEDARRARSLVQVQAKLTPVHCSWMNQVEQWFSILQRKRLRAPNLADLADLEEKILTFITESSTASTARGFGDGPHWTDGLKAAA